VLQGVIDATTIDGLTRAQNSRDPAARAEATRKTRQAVQKRLDEIANQRKLIEKTARERRKK
jgi:hypothetical protein